ncbi:three-Cys-motif partner protein TcmP [Mycobacterium sp. M26]|uniref:three-Cys-motif partner protein TcmP n=1 Tax=Mycobacterium sp. M26 TaxID=1762962 RepID=UPI000AD80539|nr:three-Cys-motif partner protein TcmP [Mycobacterium sp. M26]
MADSDPEKWVMAAHTRAKHQILQHYLGAWYPILGTWNRRVLYIDGFAGRGRYGDGSEGSPQIALRALLDHGHLKRLGNCEFVFMFIEKNRQNVESLAAELETFKASYDPWPPNVKIGVYNASFDDHMGEVITTMREQNKRLAPTFAFVDPFGYTRFPMELLGSIGSTPNSELLINFMVGFVHRFIERDGQQKSIRELYGMEVDEVLTQLEAGEDRIEQLVDVYRGKVSEAANLPLTQRFYMVNETGNISYALIHATRSKVGLSRMKAAMWKADPGGNFRFADRMAGDLVLFEPEPNLRQLRTIILSVFAGRRGVTAEELKDFVLLQTSFREPHVTPLLREFEQQKLIQVNRPPGKRQFTAGVTLDFL